MHGTNPYAQSGWVNSSISSSGSGLQPSVFGALPFIPASGSTPTIHRFQFTSFNPDICTCTVVGPGSKTYFHITNNTPTTGFTLFQNRDQKSFAVVEWRQSPGAVVELRDLIKKQLVSSWLGLSQDKMYRFMSVRDRQYVWVPREDHIGLYTHGTANPELYAKVIRGEGYVALDITTHAIQLGLLEPCVVAVVLMQSGRHID